VAGVNYFFRRQVQLSPVTRRWQLNAAAHFNEWANLHANDFFPVVDAYKAPVKQFHCDYCHSIVAVTLDHETCKSAMPCGRIDINLVKK
jgi:hypothetical protein